MGQLGLLALLPLAACTSIAAGPATLEGTRWQVTAINGRATPPAGDYRLEFERGGIGGRMGCNSMGGRYSIAGEMLTVRDVASTLMACSEPAASFESQGTAVLLSPMRIAWASDRQLTLSNAKGSIALQRIP